MIAQKPKVLIVDDTPANVLLLVRMLTDHGYITQSALSGKLALEAARAEPPDLILLDINMPTMTGYDVCQHLKNDAVLKTIPVIFISALHETIDKVVIDSLGGVAYLTKPFHLREVLASVQTHLRLSPLHNEPPQMFVHDPLNPPIGVESDDSNGSTLSLGLPHMNGSSVPAIGSPVAV